MDLAELKPAAVYTKTDDNLVFELRPFDLDAIVWAESVYGSLENMQAALVNIENWKSYSTSVGSIVFHLAKDLHTFGITTAEGFRDRINSAEGGPSKALVYLHESLKLVFFNSFDQSNEKEELEQGEIYKRKAAEHAKANESNTTDWATIFTDFSRETGISIEAFFKMTMKQVNAIYPRIDAARAEDLKLNAALHGRKLKGNLPTKHKAVKPEFSKDDQKDIQRMHDKFLQGIVDNAG